MDDLVVFFIGDVVELNQESITARGLKNKSIVNSVV